MTRIFLAGVSMITSETIHVTPVSSAYLAQRITRTWPFERSCGFRVIPSMALFGQSDNGGVHYIWLLSLLQKWNLSFRPN